MKINTKYNIGQEVWAMYCNLPFKFEIDKVIIIHDYSEISIQYRVVGRKYFFESDLFHTKEELLKSL